MENFRQANMLGLHSRGTMVAQETLTCQKCKQTLPRDTNFSACQWNDVAMATCLACTKGLNTKADSKKCCLCGLSKPRAAFSQLEEKFPSYMQKAERRKCNECMDKVKHKEARLRATPNVTKASSSKNGRKT